MWTKKDMPDLSGKIAIVTGANTGIGYETALALYEHGAHVIAACRDHVKAQQAVSAMLAFKGRGSLETGVLDLGSFSEIEIFAKSILTKYQRLDLLINNAGVMMTPAGTTVDGYELQFGINFLGHFALTGRLYPLLERIAGARVVTVSSGAAMRVDRVDFGDLKLEKEYDPNRAYAVSKLAGLQFAFELQRRLEDAGANVISVAAHPGVVRTDLGRHIPKENLEAAFSRFKAVMQPWQGALPSLYAATDIKVKGGEYYGPDGENEHAGYPALSSLVSAAALDLLQANRLWVYSEEATGVSFP